MDVVVILGDPPFIEGLPDSQRYSDKNAEDNVKSSFWLNKCLIQFSSTLFLQKQEMRNSFQKQRVLRILLLFGLVSITTLYVTFQSLKSKYSHVLFMSPLMIKLQFIDSSWVTEPSGKTNQNPERNQSKTNNLLSVGKFQFEGIYKMYFTLFETRHGAF